MNDKIVFFDIDGTLLDHDKKNYRNLHEMQ